MKGEDALPVLVNGAVALPVMLPQTALKATRITRGGLNPVELVHAAPGRIRLRAGSGSGKSGRDSCGADVGPGRSLGVNCTQLQARWPRLSTVNRTEQNRFMGTVHGCGSELLLAVKGSPPDVIALCSHEMPADGGTRPLTDASRASIAQK